MKLNRKKFLSVLLLSTSMVESSSVEASMIDPNDSSTWVRNDYIGERIINYKHIIDLDGFYKSLPSDLAPEPIKIAYNEANIDYDQLIDHIDPDFIPNGQVVKSTYGNHGQNVGALLHEIAPSATLVPLDRDLKKSDQLFE